MRSLFWAFFCLLALCVLGCAGGGVSVGSGTVNALSINPNPVHLKPKEKIQLTAILNGGTAPITWTVNTANGGTISQEGIYTAPAASGSYEIQVALTSDPSKLGKTTAIIDSGYTVSITPSSSSSTKVYAAFGGTLQLTAKVTGASTDAVTWSTTNGAVDANGLFTAPTSAGTAVVTATSVADPGKSSTVTIDVVPPVSIENDNASNTTIPMGYFKYKALVTGVESSDVDWTATSGTIDTTGKWTADASYLGNVTITATSKTDSSKSDSVTVNVVSNLNVRFSFLNQGDVVFALRPDKAPNTCANLVSLANAKFYDGIYVHRYEAGFVVQWGDPLTKTLPLTDPSIGTGGPGYTIDFEANDLLHLKYALGMARSSGLNTAGSQIYVCLDDLPSLDGNYVVFGSVASGTSVVDVLRVGDKITTARTEAP
ncbi:MAG: hypothetical protein GC165_10945 [Armatimonadetes bacterium]|nr:hypothetical protein [Armatimonadota bacterium]